MKITLANRSISELVIKLTVIIMTVKEYPVRKGEIEQLAEILNSKTTSTTNKKLNKDFGMLKLALTRIPIKVVLI